MYCVDGACTATAPTGYTVVNPAPATVSFLDACAAPGHAVYLAGASDRAVLVPLPFGFRYWATSVTAGAMVNVCSNGWIGMDGVMNTAGGGAIPDPGGGVLGDPTAAIAPNLAENMNRGPQCVADFGTSPARQWVVEWDDAAAMFVVGASHETYEVILEEATGNIDFVYQTMTGADFAVVGVMNQDDTHGVGGCLGGATDCTPTVGTVRFSPAP